jgi:hypothetical protein
MTRGPTLSQKSRDRKLASPEKGNKLTLGTKPSPDPTSKKQQNPLAMPPKMTRKRTSNPHTVEAMDALYLNPR